MDWADELAASVSGPQVVNDSKTPSGTVHVGSLRGPVVHDAIWRALRDRGTPARFLYGVDDLDAMDAASLLTPDAVDRYMGVPLADVPAPPGSDAPNYARHFVGQLFFPTFERLGIRPEFYWMSEVYRSGALDVLIRRALDRADVVRDIYRRVSRVEKPSGWLPIQPICENCGRVGTTIATDWDGETVRYQCLPDLVKWATGCGHNGRLSPFGGRAALPWNLDWAAKWSHFGITIEGCGKDLATAGGSRDRSDAIARDVFEREPPSNVAYEFLNVGGRKMSTSRGTGAAAHTIAEVVPPEQLRFLFLRPRPNQAIEFNPDGTDAIPRLFDEFDRIADATAGREVRGELPPHPERLFELSLVDPDADVPAEAAAFRPAFGHLSLLVQVPGVDVAEQMAAEKGSPLTAAEQTLLAGRIAAVRRWLETYAPESARYAVMDDLPAEAARLGEDQRLFLGALALRVDEGTPHAGAEWQAAIFAVATSAGLPAGRAFGALYLAFLGRTNGPRAGWLLASLDPGFVARRLREAAGWRPAEAVPAGDGR
ncbi:MAG: lysine--tRNA ligase [Chloroflexi bacterium]|nr:lysine--tRNA ligase [Chloroflexota bacterium]